MPFCHFTAQAVLNVTLREYITLHWLPVADRIQYKLLLLVIKVFRDNASKYLTKLLMLASGSPVNRLLETHSIYL